VRRILRDGGATQVHGDSGNTWAEFQRTQHLNGSYPRMPMLESRKQQEQREIEQLIQELRRKEKALTKAEALRFGNTSRTWRTGACSLTLPWPGR